LPPEKSLSRVEAVNAALSIYYEVLDGEIVLGRDLSLHWSRMF
jgi:hypothetical protein